MVAKKTENVTLAAAKAHLLKQEGAGSVVDFSGEAEAVPVIPTGSFLIDVITGIGGLPQGRIVEFFGEESSGKSTVLSSCAAQCQKVLKRPVLYLDYEYALDKRYMLAQGVDLSEDWFVYAQPQTMEQGLRIAEYYISNNLIGLVVADSVAAMLTEAESSGDMGNTHAGGIANQARVMAAAMKKLVKLCSTTGTTFAFINQTRTAPPSTPFEKQRGISTETTPGGKALKFYASMRIKFTKLKAVSGKVYNPVQGVWEDGSVATKVKAQVVKNKMAPPFRKCDFIIRYGVGVDDIMSLITVAIDRKIIKKSGSFFAIPDRYHGSGEKTNIQGLGNVCDYFRNDWPSGFTLLEDDIHGLIQKDLEATGETYQAEEGDFEAEFLELDTFAPEE
jgi:recombination protein RecA